jgi:hypothetical protein
MSDIDYDRLLKLRLVVGRHGEMEPREWWKTRGQLGRPGAAVLRRGFPRTHRFAQARSVFAVAAHRCAEVFTPPAGVTLWRLPEPIEEEFDLRWEHWLDHAEEWSSFFSQLEALGGEGLPSLLEGFDLVTPADREASLRLKRSHEGRAVALPGVFRPANSTLALLALGFQLGEPGGLAVPYIRSES